MARYPRRLCRDQLTVEPFLGSSAYGDRWGPAVTVWANVSTSTQLVAGGTSGDTDLAELTTVLMPPTADLVDGSGTLDATALTTTARIRFGEDDTRRLRRVQVHSVRGRPFSVELSTT